MIKPRTRHARVRMLLCALAGALLLIATAAAAPALAQESYWALSSSPEPSYLAPGSEGKIVATASNLGDAVMGAETPITITDTLPAGLTAVKVTGSRANETVDALECKVNTATQVSCLDVGKTLQPLTGFKLIITVKVSSGLTAGTVLQNTVEASGGAAKPASVKEPVRIETAETPFGVEKYEFKPEEEGGAPDARAGSHPFQLTTSIAINQNSTEEPVAMPKNLKFNLPPGLLGNPTLIPQCSQADFTTVIIGPRNLCPPSTVVGVAQVTIDEPLVFQGSAETRTVPVFNLEPSPGEPARFGLMVLKVPVVLETSVRTGSDYGVVVTAKNTSQAAGLVSSRVTFWGVPADPRHGLDRGWNCVENHSPTACQEQQNEEAKKAKEEKEKGEEPKAFLSLPTSCTGPLHSPMQAQSWVPGAPYLPPVESEFVESMEGCNLLSLEPTLSVQPDTQAGSTPAGLTVGIGIPQEEAAGGLARSAVKSTTVALPEGVQLNPGAANGLLACSILQFGFQGAEEKAQTNNSEFTPGRPSCPDAAKVGTVAIKSPDLKHELEGSVYLAAQDTNPFEPPLVLYLVAEDPVSGVLVKLAGTVVPNPTTGQLVSTFENTPQVPFESLKLKFFSGPRASISTPAVCGGYETTSSFAPWSGGSPAAPHATFSITAGCSSNPLPFSPSFAAGSTNLQGGAFTNFALTINRPDGHQALEGLTMKLPAGMAAVLASVTPCQEPQAARNECGPDSLIGHSVASSGLGGTPFNLPGQVFLTGPYKGAPFGLSVVTPAIAGPFNLGDVTVRSTISVDPNTAAVTIHSDPFPTILKGVPTQLKQIHVEVDRSNFQFNPTNCNRMSIEGTLSGSQGGATQVSSPFQVENCGSLPFAPKLTARVDGTGSKPNGVGFYVRLESPGIGQANIHKVELQLPIALPSRLSTIQQACPDNVFEANPAGCGEGSVIGKAVIRTPVLKNPLEGPAYLVSHANLAFPDVVFVLQGENIKLVLDGHTDIKKGITYSRFESAPDAPFSTFETSLPAGPHSALGVNVDPSKNYSLCGANLAMPTKIVSQSEGVIEETTQIAATGCGAVKQFKESALQKALKACKKKFKKNKKKRIACERAARKKYGPHPKHKSHKKKK